MATRFIFVAEGETTGEEPFQFCLVHHYFLFLLLDVLESLLVEVVAELAKRHLRITQHFFNFALCRVHVLWVIQQLSDFLEVCVNRQLVIQLGHRHIIFFRS